VPRDPSVIVTAAHGRLEAWPVGSTGLEAQRDPRVRMSVHAGTLLVGAEGDTRDHRKLRNP
jgi:hypothetical protein